MSLYLGGKCTLIHNLCLYKLIILTKLSSIQLLTYLNRFRYVGSIANLYCEYAVFVCDIVVCGFLNFAY